MTPISLTQLLRVTALGRATRVSAKSEDDPIPLSYLIKQMQIGVVRELIPVLNVLATGWVDDRCQIRSNRWTKDKMAMTIWQPNEGAQDPGGGAVADVEFMHLGWDPEHTDETFGDRVVLNSLDKTYKGAGFLAALRNAPNPLDYRQTQTVNQEHSRQVTLDRETSIDIGAEVGTTVGGEVAGVGVSVETKLSTEFGEKVDNTQTDSESKSQSIEKEITYQFPAGDFDYPDDAQHANVDDATSVADQRCGRIRHANTVAHGRIVGQRHCAPVHRQPDRGRQSRWRQEGAWQLRDRV